MKKIQKALDSSIETYFLTNENPYEDPFCHDSTHLLFTSYYKAINRALIVQY